MSELTYFAFDTETGWVGILGSAKGLRRLVFARRSAEDMPEISTEMATWAPHLYQDVAERLKLYFGGHRVAFPDPLDLSRATEFQRRVWQTTRDIPSGETRNYGWIAGEMGKPKGMRAVGQALARNPLPIIIPCHRVVTSDGRLGGYGGGLGLKRYLLRLEASANLG